MLKLLTSLTSRHAVTSCREVVAVNSTHRGTRGYGDGGHGSDDVRQGQRTGALCQQGEYLQMLITNVVISTYINTKMSVCLFVCLLRLISAISKPIGIPFGTKLI